MWFYRRILKILWTEQWRSLKENANLKNTYSGWQRELKFLKPIMRKEHLKNLTLTGHIEDERLGKALSHLHDKFVWMDGETGCGRLSKGRNVTTGYRGLEAVEKHDRTALEWTWHVEEECYISCNPHLSGKVTLKSFYILRQRWNMENWRYSDAEKMTTLNIYWHLSIQFKVYYFF